MSWIFEREHAGRSSNSAAQQGCTMDVIYFLNEHMSCIDLVRFSIGSDGAQVVISLAISPPTSHLSLRTTSTVSNETAEAVVAAGQLLASQPVSMLACLPTQTCTVTVLILELSHEGLAARPILFCFHVHDVVSACELSCSCPVSLSG